MLNIDISNINFNLFSEKYGMVFLITDHFFHTVKLTSVKNSHKIWQTIRSMEARKRYPIYKGEEAN